MLQILSRWYRGGVSNPEQIYSNTSSLSISPFPEEPLALSAQEGFGFFLGRSGLLLNKGRYEVLRKLGKGKFSSTWLACDSQYVILSTIHIVEIELVFAHLYAVPSGRRKGCDIVPSKF